MNPEDLKGMNGRRALVEGVIEDWRRGPKAIVTVVFDGIAVDIPCSAIREILPKEIKVGDLIKTDVLKRGTVRALYGRVAWIEEQGGGLYTYALSDLTLAEPNQ